MTAVTRKGDMTTGHSCFPPRPCLGESSFFYANGIPLHLEGQGQPTHCCGDTCHASTTSKGSSLFFVDGIPTTRTGDPTSCGDAHGEGSPNFSIFS